MWILFFLISLFSSTIGAISGIGGGVIIKPVLDATGVMSVSTISFLSGCTVLSMAVVSLIKSRNSDIKIDKVKSTYLGIGAALGGIIGKGIFDIITTAFTNENHVGAIQAALLFITIAVCFYIKNAKKIKTYDVKNVVICFIIGLVLGIISAFLGIGGGPINIAVLYLFFSMDSKTAAKNSIYIILFSQISSLFSTIINQNIPEFEFIIIVFMVLGGILGGLIGSVLSKKASNKQLDQLFSVLLFVIMGINLFNIVKFLG